MTTTVGNENLRQVADAINGRAQSLNRRRLARAVTGWRPTDAKSEAKRAYARRRRYEQLMAARTAEENTDALIDDLQWLAASGEGQATILHRLGYSNPDSLARRLQRAGRGDLTALIRTEQP